jgi:isocitrate dehydrogenase kinase/phosphatase
MKTQHFQNPESLIYDSTMAILSGFNAYRTVFDDITKRAAEHFCSQNWVALHEDANRRLDHYNQVLSGLIDNLQKNILREKCRERIVWSEIRTLYKAMISNRGDIELAETFYNSVCRRIFSTVGVDDRIEFVDSDFEVGDELPGMPMYKSFEMGEVNHATITTIFLNKIFDYEDLQRDTIIATREISEHLKQAGLGNGAICIDVLDPVFYRGKAAYVVGRVTINNQIIPIVFAFRNHATKIYLDAILLTQDEVSVLFSFTRSYFHVEVEIPHTLVSFLRTILPHKRIYELYTAIGYYRHGKTELFRDFIRHLKCASDQFEIAPGERGMVMLVFTLPSFDIVFKLIKDHFDEPKNTTKDEVKSKYQLVFHHDRAGRLVDAQEFEHLEFARDRFSPKLLDEMLTYAPSSVQVRGETVAIQHLYTERRMVPLDIYIRNCDPGPAAEVVVDYGQAIKDLAATNIFPGDILLKNFGVTRQKRVVFYDYDELTWLTECNFRILPTATDEGDEFGPEPWFYVGKSDIFPEEFKTFLGLTGQQRDLFNNAHSDIFGLRFWKRMQKLHQQGEVIEILPYKEGKRLSVHPL